MKERTLLERFGEPIGNFAGQSLVGVRDEREDVNVCPECGMMPIGGQCGCQEVEQCSSCKMLPTSMGSSCGCSLAEGRKKRRGPSKKTAKKILRGTKTFKAKIKKVEKWADNPAAAAAWLQHKATGEWPSEK